MAPLVNGGRSKERASLRDSSWVGVAMVSFQNLSGIYRSRDRRLVC